MSARQAPARATRRMCVAVLLASSATPPAFAQEAPAQSTSAAVELPTIAVEGSASPSNLDVPNSVGSLVGLTPRETPATVNIVTQKDMQEKGLRTVVETLNSVPGVTSGNLPGEPAVISMRGFSRAATGYAIDGVRAVDPLIVARDYDTFSFERIEILKGPASVIQGTGALAGAVNLVTKQPRLQETSAEGLISYGSFNSLRTGIDVNAPIGPEAAVRSTLSYGQSDGYIDDTNSRKVGLTTSGAYAPTDRLSFSGSVNYFHDEFKTPYQGIPLIPRSVARDPTNLVSAPNGLVVDRSIRDQNYNVINGLMESDTVWLRGGAEYKLTGSWTLKNELSFFKADRIWANSEDFTFNAMSGLLDRTTTKITHDHQFWSERATAAHDGMIGGFRNRFSAGVEYIDTALQSDRRFGTTGAVDPFNPSRGYFPADTAANFATRQDFDSALKTFAVFAENAINLTPDWLVLASIRHESMKLDRRIDDLNTGAMSRFDKTFEDLSWRIGTVYNVTPGTALFAQYNEAAIPVATLLLSNTANGRFELSTGRSVEGGIKASFWSDRVVATASVYQIEQDNILTRDPINPALTVQGGSQRSRGIELDVSVALTEQWKAGGNASFIDAEFTELRSASRDLRGNRPVNVPAEAFMIWTSYRFAQIPLTIGASIQRVGSFYTDTANTIEVSGRTLLDAWLAYDIAGGTLRLRGRNLTNAFYADWSGYSSTQVYLGAPRSFDVSYNIKF
ncbi:TonB-dependent siderophore receptor [Bradyrhizobium sp. LHD-71]|uniref:TonB-dependent receptor n=1 Tax=Bradyrhizobium sp. LHD-71 TaxID=3072141 RepID=UPI00280CB752|nr:TonB-dependent siderophore receptor [Bradyrhizobium sp. LHD-71]MDQ8726634.1 TonB-dependent siderophore receptor [Bradyrhizobium sp. LHD-71]